MDKLVIFMNSFSDTGQLWNIVFCQLSLTFITVSIISVLSDKTPVLYWKNLMQDKLMSDKIFNLYNYVIGLTVMMLLSFVAIIFECGWLMLISFCASILILTVLTFSILQVYFRRDKEKEKAKRQFAKASDKKHKIVLLKEHTIEAALNNDFEVLSENLSFYASELDADSLYFFMYMLDESRLLIFQEAVYDNLLNRMRKELVDNKAHFGNWKEEDDSLYAELQKLNIFGGFLTDFQVRMIQSDEGEKYYDSYGPLLDFVKRYLVIYVSSALGQNIPCDRDMNYYSFRKKIRSFIIQAKEECGGDDQVYNRLIHEKARAELICMKNDQLLREAFQKDPSKRELLEIYVRNTPIQFVLSLLDLAMFPPEGVGVNYYFITQFAWCFSEFPIFKYLLFQDNTTNSNVVSGVRKQFDEIRYSLKDMPLEYEWKYIMEEIFVLEDN